MIIFVKNTQIKQNNLKKKNTQKLKNHLSFAFSSVSSIPLILISKFNLAFLSGDFSSFKLSYASYIIYNI